jgi:hypothetical protein
LVDIQGVALYVCTLLFEITLNTLTVSTLPDVVYYSILRKAYDTYSDQSLTPFHRLGPAPKEAHGGTPPPTSDLAASNPLTTTLSI